MNNLAPFNPSQEHTGFPNQVQGYYWRNGYGNNLASFNPNQEHLGEINHVQI